MSLLAAKVIPLASADSTLSHSRQLPEAFPGNGRGLGGGAILSMDFRVQMDNPRAVFSDGRNIFLASDLRHLTKFSINGGLKKEARADLGENGVESFTGFDRNSRYIWAVSYHGRTLRILDRNLRLQRAVPIPRNEGIYFTYQGREYFIDAYNSPYVVHSLEGKVLTRLPVAVPPSPFARDFLAMAYGYPFPVFYYKASHIVLGFDGHTFQRLSRFKVLDSLMYDCIQISKKMPLFLTISNNRLLSTFLTIFGKNPAPLATIRLRGLYNSGSFCVGSGYAAILSHHQRTLSFLALERLFDGTLLSSEIGLLGDREG